MKKIVLSALLVCAMLLTVAAPAWAEVNTEGYPIVTEPLTLKVVVAEGSTSNTHSGMWSLVRLAEETGIVLEIERIDNSVWPDRKPLLFAGNDLPDLIIGGFSKADLTTYTQSGQLTPINDMLPYMPNYIEYLKRFDNIELASLFDADMNMLGFVASASEGPRALPGVRSVINGKWLKDLGLEMPTDWDSLVNVLIAFRDNDCNGNGDPNDEYPVSGTANAAFVVTESLDISNTTGKRSNWIEGEDGSMQYLMTNDIYKEFLHRMHFLFAEKLLDNEYYTQSQTQFLAKGANMQVGVCQTNAPFVLCGTDPEKYEQYVGFGPISPDGQSPKQYFNEMYGMNLFVTKANQHRVETARLLNYLYTEEWAEICRGPEKGSEVKGDWDGNGGWYWLDDAQTEYTVDVPSEYSGVYYWRIGAVAPTCIRGGWGYSDTFQKEQMAPTDVHLRAIYKDFWDLTTPCFPQAYSLTAEESDELSLITPELETYVSQMEVKFVIGELDIDENWDAYQKHLKDIGVDEYIAIHQGAYARYLNIARNLDIK